MANRNGKMVNDIPRYSAGRALLFLGLFVSLIALCCSVQAQEPDETAPPPLKMLSKTERGQLTAKAEPKERTSLALQLMEARLRSAEKFRTDENYSLMYAELGGFQALMDNTLDFLLRSNIAEGKRLNSLKRLEIGLRSFVPRVEEIRRETPANFEPYLKYLIKYIGDVREKAMQSFFSNTVVSRN
jgi:hypothetical protein